MKFVVRLLTEGLQVLVLPRGWGAPPWMRNHKALWHAKRSHNGGVGFCSNVSRCLTPGVVDQDQRRKNLLGQLTRCLHDRKIRFPKDL